MHTILRTPSSRTFASAMLACALIVLVGSPLHAQTADELRRTASRVYGTQATLADMPVAISSSEAERLGESSGIAHPWSKVEVYRVRSGAETRGWLCVDNVKGKSRPITYAVCFDGAGSILDIEILKYRESHGGEVASETFRAQFRGKSASSAMQVGRDIRNISGATISTRAVTRGAKALAVLVRHIATREVTP